MSFVTYERRGLIGLVTLNRPERMNAISGDLLSDLQKALWQATDDAETSVIVLTGAGRAFCAGDDLKEFDQQSESEASVRSHVSAIQVVTKQMLGAEKPIVGALHGYAVGGGFEWVLNCDLVVASDNLIAFFPEMGLANFVTGGVTHLLPQVVGYQRSMELLLLGERQTATRLQELGLVNWVVPQEQMLAKAFEVAEQIASKSKHSVGRLKRMLNVDLGEQLWRAVELEEQATVEAFLRPEAAEQVKQFARAKR